MPAKHLTFRSTAPEKVMAGATALADAVRVTLGPKSRCVLIEKDWGPPIVCNDGVTIAKQLELADREENLGAQLLRQAAERTGDVVGDGTTTSTLPMRGAPSSSFARSRVRLLGSSSPSATRARKRLPGPLPPGGGSGAGSCERVGR